MGSPAKNFELENTVEQRVATLEADVRHIRADISEMKGDVRRLDSKIDDVKSSVAALAVSTERSFATAAVSAERSFAALTERISKQTFWLVGLLITVATALLGLMAGGFLWLADQIGR